MYVELVQLRSLQKEKPPRCVCLLIHPVCVCVCWKDFQSGTYTIATSCVAPLLGRLTVHPFLSFCFGINFFLLPFLYPSLSRKFTTVCERKRLGCVTGKKPQILAPFYFFNQPEDFADFSVVTSQQGVVTKSFFFEGDVLILGTRQVWNGAGRRRYSWKFLFLLQFYQTCMERERKVERTKRVMQWQWANTTRPDTPDMKNKDNLRVPLDLTWVDGKKRDVKKKKKKKTWAAAIHARKKCGINKTFLLFDFLIPSSTRHGCF
jgi:hypothetical protein